MTAASWPPPSWSALSVGVRLCRGFSMNLDSVLDDEEPTQVGLEPASDSCYLFAHDEVFNPTAGVGGVRV